MKKLTTFLTYSAAFLFLILPAIPFIYGQMVWKFAQRISTAIIDKAFETANKTE